MVLNKDEIIEQVAEINGISKVEATRTVNSVFSVIAANISRGDDVRVHGSHTIRTLVEDSTK